MWAKFRTSKLNEGKKEMKGNIQRSLNVNEEYFHALRTKSYADFFTKAQSLVNDQQSSPSYYHHKFSEILLEPGEETITTILESAKNLPEKSNLKSILYNYFNISAEASRICSHLLKSINQVQSHYRFMQQMLDTLDDYSSEQLSFMVVELQSFIDLNNPFSNENKQEFKTIHEKYSSVLQTLKSKRKKVAKKIKLIKIFNKASGICVTAACGLVAVTGLILAAHTLTALILGPFIFTLPIKPLKKKLMNFKYLKSKILNKIGNQLDVAAKGTYILNRDFDTMSRLVSRLHDEVEHNKTMIQFCLDRKEKDDKLSLQVLKEVRKSDVEFRKQVEELEQHLYLCLVTINRARVLVIKEVAKSCGD